MIEKTNVKADGLFSEAEAEFLAENFIGRLATVSSGLQPHVVPVAYRFDGSGLTFGGWNMEKSLKFKNLAANNQVAFVVDEVVSMKPWKARGVEVRGTAVPTRSPSGSVSIRITPLKVRSWGLQG
ncbi:MAG TPA: PPOX class F420-dependent oxidoreductase [Nitrososphaerales archaeon]|nr:PPOX class F420-dependent oxidoreductase [Nitrososphaerales archaeon]